LSRGFLKIIESEVCRRLQNGSGTKRGLHTRGGPEDASGRFSLLDHWPSKEEILKAQIDENIRAMEDDDEPAFRVNVTKMVTNRNFVSPLLIFFTIFKNKTL
jgi:hypothetical protein